MQTISQPQYPRRGPKRNPDEGNILWKLYRELGYTGREAFWAMMRELPLTKSSFSKYSGVGFALGRLETRLFFAYREFFLTHSGHDLLEDYLAEAPGPLTPIAH